MNAQRRKWIAPSALLACLMLSGLAAAQPVPSRAPDSTHIFPAGGRRGTSIAVRVGAECLPPGADFFLFGKGLSAPARLEHRLEDAGEPSPRRLPTEIPASYPKEWESHIELAADAPLGVAYWRVSCAQGGTACRPFVIGDLPEHVEQESNSTPDRAEQVTLPVTLNGQIHGERDTDYYRFALQQGQTVAVETVARRLGSRLDPIVELATTDGDRLPVIEHHVGGDPVLACRAPNTGQYLLRIAHVSVHGGPAHVYRVNVTTRPFVQMALPPGGAAGQAAEIELLTLGDRPPLRRPVQFPSQPGPFQLHDDRLAAPVTLFAEAVGGRLEQEPNDSQHAQLLAADGTAVYGQLAARDDDDWYRFQSAAGQRWQIVCQAFPPGSTALPVVQIVADGKPLTTARNVESPDFVCRLQWQAPGDGEFQVRVHDLRFGSRGEPASQYRLLVSPADPDFSLTLDSDVLNVVQGGRAELTVHARRSGGFDDKILLQVEGLPDHVQLRDSTIPLGQSSGKLILEAGEQAVAQSTQLQIVGVAEIGGQERRRTALAAHHGIDSEGAGANSRSSRFFLTVQHKPVYRLTCEEAYLYAHRGSVFPYPMSIERLDGFQGEVHLQIGDRQNRDLDGIQMVPITAAPGQSLVRMPIYLPETMHINVQSQSQLYTQSYARFTDQHGRQQSVLVVCEKRNMLRTRPPVAKLIAEQARVTAEPGGQARIPLRLKRTSNFPGSLRVRLGQSSHDGARAKPLVIPAGSDRAEMLVSAPADAPPGDQVQITLRGEGEHAGGVTIVSETQVTLVLAEPSTGG